MKKLFEQWYWLGLSKETVNNFSEKVAYDNLRILQVESIAVAILCFVSSIITMFLDYNPMNEVVLLVTSCANIILFFFASHIRKNGGTHFTFTTAVSLVVLFYEIFSFWVSIYFDLAYAASYATLLVGAIIIAEISYDINPLQNFITIVISVSIFGFLSRNLKPFEIHVWDMCVVGSFAIVGAALEWKKARIRYEREEAIEIIKRNNTDLYHTSLTDPLTGLFNRRAAFEKLEVLAAQCHVKKKQITCMIFDLDNFKTFNDMFGHPEGDKLLKELGAFLLELGLENNLIVSRIGGEEFLAFYSEDNKVDIDDITQKIMAGVRKLYHPQKAEGKYNTMSIGVYSNIAKEEDTAERIYQKADRALYEAKKAGRDRVVFYDNSVER